jgi:hypothetical protein
MIRLDQNWTASLPIPYLGGKVFPDRPPPGADRLPNYDVKELYRQTGFVLRFESMDHEFWLPAYMIAEAAGGKPKQKGENRNPSDSGKPRIDTDGHGLGNR